MSEATPERGALIGGGGVIAAAAAGYALLGGTRYTADFTQLWAATRALLSGISPYDEAAVLALVPADVVWPVLPWAYPPWTTLILAPFGALPLDVAGRLWSILSAGAVAIAALWVANAKTPPGRMGVAAAATLAFPTLGLVAVGQLVAPVAVGAALLIRSSHAATTAIGLVLLATKPHLGLPVALAHFGWMALARNRSAARGWVLGAAMGLGLLGVCFALDPHWPGAWRAAIERLRGEDTFRLCDTCASATAAAQGPSGRMGVALLIGAAGWAIARRRDLWGDRAAVVSAGLLCGLVFLPYVRNYDHALAVLPLVAVWSRADRNRRQILVVAWLLPWLSLGLSREAGTIPYWLSAIAVAGVWAVSGAGAGAGTQDRPAS